MPVPCSVVASRVQGARISGDSGCTDWTPLMSDSESSMNATGMLKPKYIELGGKALPPACATGSANNPQTTARTRTGSRKILIMCTISSVENWNR